MASYDGATLKVTELFSTGHSTANLCLWRLHGSVLDFIYLLATGVAEIAESTNLKACPHPFGDVVYHLPRNQCSLSQRYIIHQVPGVQSVQDENCLNKFDLID